MTEQPKYKNYRIKTPLADRIAKRLPRTKRSMTKEIEALLEAALKREAA